MFQVQSNFMIISLMFLSFSDKKTFFGARLLTTFIMGTSFNLKYFHFFWPNAINKFSSFKFIVVQDLSLFTRFILMIISSSYIVQCTTIFMFKINSNFKEF